MLDKLLGSLNRNISVILDSPYIIGILTIFVYAYVVYIKIPMPAYLERLFNNGFFRALALFLILIIGFENKPHVALVASLIFVFSMKWLYQTEILRGIKLFESYRNIDKFEDTLETKEHSVEGVAYNCVEQPAPVIFEKIENNINID